MERRALIRVRLHPMVQAIQTRGQERRAQNKLQQSANVTADYLDSIGQKDIANLVRQQAIGGAEGLKLGTAGSGTDTTDYKNLYGYQGNAS